MGGLPRKTVTLADALRQKAEGVMTPPQGDDVMPKLLSKRQVREMVTLSYAQTARLEAAGKFPKRVQISQNRVAYVQEEIEDWITSRIQQRKSP